MSYNVPVLFLIFNRPGTASKVFAEIKKVQPKQLFIAADGPRQHKEGEKELCEKTRKMIIDEIDWECDVKTLFRDENLGCKKAVSSAINWFFENVEYGIILEDDCLPNASFFEFQEEMLERYKNDTRIMVVSGCNFHYGNKRGNASYYFSKLIHIWGWGTWRRAWKMYDANMETFEKFKEENQIKNIWEKEEVQEYWLRHFQLVVDEKINTWDYQWVYTIMKNNGLTINPNVNLISNIVIGEAGTHAGAEDISGSNNIPLEDLNGEIIHPDFILPDREAEEYEHKYVFCARKKARGLMKIWREIKRIFRKLEPIIKTV